VDNIGPSLTGEQFQALPRDEQLKYKNLTDRSKRKNKREGNSLGYVWGRVEGATKNGSVIWFEERNVTHVKRKDCKQIVRT
jgi:hypothetical protein